MRFRILLKRVTTVALFALAQQLISACLYVEFLPGNYSHGSHHFQLFERSGSESTAISLLVSKSRNQMHKIIYYPDDEEFYEWPVFVARQQQQKQQQQQYNFKQITRDT